MPTTSIRVPPRLHTLCQCRNLGWFRALSSNPYPLVRSPGKDHVTRLILDQDSPVEALRLFRWAKEIQNFTHSQSTYRALIYKLCWFHCFEAVEGILKEIPRTLNSPPEAAIFITLVRGMARAGMVSEIVRVPELAAKFYDGRTPSVKIFNSILDILVKVDVDLAKDFFQKRMMAEGVRSDDYTYGILMKGLCATNQIGEAYRLLYRMKKSSKTMLPNSVMYNTLIHCLCRTGNVREARGLMKEMDSPSDVTFNIMISAYCSEGDLIRALVMLERCFSANLLPDIIAVTKVLQILCDSNRVPDAVEMLDRFESKGGKSDHVSHNTLIRGFCKSGKLKVGIRMKEEMEIKGCLPNVDTYNILISGFCGTGAFDSAMELFDEMKSVGLQWNVGTFDALIRGFCSKGKMKEGFESLKLMEENRLGLRSQISPYNSILYGFYIEGRTDKGHKFLENMKRHFPKVVSRSLKILDLCNRSEISKAKSIYDEMISDEEAPSAFVYSSLITGFCREGLLREALELMNEMIGSGYPPVASTFNSIIHGFCSNRRLIGATTLIEDLVSRGCALDAESYVPVVRGLCEGGYYYKAMRVFPQMVDKGIVPDYLLWNSLVLCLSRQKRWVGMNVEKNLEYITATC